METKTIAAMSEHRTLSHEELNKAYSKKEIDFKVVNYKHGDLMFGTDKVVR